MCVGSPTAGAWSSFQRRPDDEFETDRWSVRSAAQSRKLEPNRCATAAILYCQSSVDVAIGLPLRIGNMRSLPIFRETDPTAPSPSSLRRYGRWHSRPHAAKPAR